MPFMIPNPRTSRLSPGGLQTTRRAHDELLCRALPRPLHLTHPGAGMAQLLADRTAWFALGHHTTLTRVNPSFHIIPDQKDVDSGWAWRVSGPAPPYSPAVR